MINEVTLNDIAVVIVLYGKKLLETQTYQTLLESAAVNSQTINLIVYDNSLNSSSSPSSKYIELLNYYHDSSNPGLSKAYNQSARIAKRKGKNWLLIFDQDTEVTNTALNSYVEAMNGNSQISIFCPVLMSHDLIVSPSIFKNRCGHSPENINTGVNSLKKLSPLNSGLLVSLDLFFEVKGYDEKVPLDYSDYAFVDRIKEKVELFYVINEKLNHGLSSHEQISYTSALFRFKSLCYGLVNSSKSNRDMLLSFLVAFKRCLRLSVLFRSSKFCKILLDNFVVKFII